MSIPEASPCRRFDRGNNAPAWTVFAALVLLLSATGYADAEEPSNLDRSADPAQLSMAFQHAAGQVLPAVVIIETLRGPRQMHEWTKREASLRAGLGELGSEASCPHCSADHSQDGTGSGIIIDARGWVLTCNHVIASADTVFVRLPDGRKFEGTDVHADAVTDLAILRIKGAGALPEARLGDSDDLTVGDWVVSVGSPYGLGPSVAAGIVSATDRQLPDVAWTRLIQSDAASNPGNSGGALINLQGEVIGISEGGYGRGGGFQGIGFAIPVNSAMRIARQLIADGEVRRGYLGCHMQDLAPDVSRYLELPEGRGLLVCDIEPRSPASVAGIQLGDVLTAFAGTPIRGVPHMYQLLEEVIPGEEYEISLIRGGEKVEVAVRLDRVPAREERPRRSNSRIHAQPPRYSDHLLGLALDDLAPETARELGFEHRDAGVLITHVMRDQAAYRNGICAGMLILHVGNDPTPNLAEYRKAMKSQSLERGVFLIVGTPTHNFATVLRKTFSASGAEAMPRTGK